MATKAPKAQGAKPTRANKAPQATAWLQQWDQLLRLQRAERQALAQQQLQARQALQAKAAGKGTSLATVQAACAGHRQKALRALTLAQEQAVKAAPATTSHTALARQFGVSVATISRLRNGLTYAN